MIDEVYKKVIAIYGVISIGCKLIFYSYSERDYFAAANVEFCVSSCVELMYRKAKFHSCALNILKKFLSPMRDHEKCPFIGTLDNYPMLIYFIVLMTQYKEGDSDCVVEIFDNIGLVEAAKWMVMANDVCKNMWNREAFDKDYTNGRLFVGELFMNKAMTSEITSMADECAIQKITELWIMCNKSDDKFEQKVAVMFQKGRHRAHFYILAANLKAVSLT